MAEEKVKKPMNPALKQWLVPIAVLVCICLVCGLLLALCNDLLYVSEQDKFNRKIRKVWDGYGANVDFKEETLNAEFKANPNYGEVLSVRSAPDGSYVLTSKGTVGAFNGGSVTILVAIGPNPEAKILGWALQENEGQTFIANITEKHQKEWFVGSTVSDVQAMVTPNAGQGKGSGATYTENALANAINMACYYCQNALGLGANPEGDAKKAVTDLLAEKGIEGYTLSTFGSKSVIGTELDGEGNELKYIFVGEGEGTLYAYTYGADADIKIVVVKDGKLVANSANVTGEEDFVAKILAKPILEVEVTSGVKLYTFVTAAVEDGNKKVYTVIGIKLGSYVPNNYTLKVTIVTEGGKGKVDDIAIATGGNGYEPGRPSEDDANKLVTSLKGVTLADIDSKYASDKVAGATESANIITAAVKAALTHYDASNASND